MEGLKKPRYTFGDVSGAMKEGRAVSVGVDNGDHIDISFYYRDNQDGKLYHVEAIGHRSEIKEQPIAKR
jgi:hypothetical protein